MSQGLIYLTDQEFSLVPPTNGMSGQVPGQSPQEMKYELVHRIKGVSMVFFYSKSCPMCTNLKEQYKTLPGKVQGVSFAIANVTANDSRLQKMASASSTPIMYVPYLVIYIDGHYYLEYRGPKTVDSIVRAAYEIVAKLTSGKEFGTGRVCKNDSGKDGYCTVDYNLKDDKNMCYTYEECYLGKKSESTAPSKCYTYEECYGRVAPSK